MSYDGRGKYALVNMLHLLKSPLMRTRAFQIDCIAPRSPHFNVLGCTRGAALAVKAIIDSVMLKAVATLIIYPKQSSSGIRFGLPEYSPTRSLSVNPWPGLLLRSGRLLALWWRRWHRSLVSPGTAKCVELNVNLVLV